MKKFKVEKGQKLKINTTMKIKAIIFGLLAALPLLSQANVAEDTVVIKFGNNSKIVIYVDNSEDLKSLEAYDINQIIADLNISLDSANNTTYLVIEDESGEKYLKDTIVNTDANAKTDTDVDVDREPYVWNNNRSGNSYSDWTDWSSRFNDDDHPFNVRRTRQYFNVDIGTSNWMSNGKIPNNEQYTVKPWASWYIGLNSIQKTSIDGPLFLEWGPGISWYNWKFEDRTTRVTKGDTEVEFNAETPLPGVDYRMSKLGTSYINFSVVPMLDFSYGNHKVEKDGKFKKYTTKKRDGIRIGAGMYAGMRLGGRAVYTIKENGDKDKIKDKNDYYLENFRYGIRGQVGFKGVDFFANYDLNNVFTSGNGPKLNGFSFGLIF